MELLSALKKHFGYDRFRRLQRESGHLPYYAESMFPAMRVTQASSPSAQVGFEPADAERAGMMPAETNQAGSLSYDLYYLKAMSCPHLRYKDRDNVDKIPICIHRAPLGTHERFIGFLIEHYAGNFPLWLSPEQVRILTIGDEPKLMDYARSILKELRARQVRAEIDESSDKINGKIQRAEQMKVHTMFVIGKRDLEAAAVSVRVHGKGNLGAKPRDQAIADLMQMIHERNAS